MGLNIKTIVMYDENIEIPDNAVYLLAKLKCIPTIKENDMWYYRPNQRWFPLGNNNKEAFAHLVEMKKNCLQL